MADHESATVASGRPAAWSALIETNEPIEASRLERQCLVLVGNFAAEEHLTVVSNPRVGVQIVADSSDTDAKLGCKTSSS